MLFFRSRRRRLSLSSLLLPQGADYNAHESINCAKNRVRRFVINFGTSSKLKQPVRFGTTLIFQSWL